MKFNYVLRQTNEAVVVIAAGGSVVDAVDFGNNVVIALSFFEYSTLVNEIFLIIIFDIKSPYYRFLDFDDRY